MVIYVFKNNIINSIMFICCIVGAIVFGLSHDWGAVIWAIVAGLSLLGWIREEKRKEKLREENKRLVVENKSLQAKLEE
jgi:hypothetical protein